MHAIDTVHIAFNPAGLLALNAVLALLMFGIALEIRTEDFKVLLTRPRAFVVALSCQYLLMPLLALGMIALLQPPPSVALGLILVAACPSGNLSNYLTHVAHGNTALSVGITSLSTLAAIVLTPLMLTTVGSLSPVTAGLIKSVSVSPWRMAWDVGLVIALPLATGLYVAKQHPSFTRHAKKIQLSAFALLLLFVLIGSLANLAIYREWLWTAFFIVLLGDALAFSLAYTLGWATRLPERDRRALAFETGKRNTGLGLVLVFSFFGGLGGMALVAAWWGTWDIVVGTVLARLWAKRPISA